MSQPITLTVPLPKNIANGGHYHWRKVYSAKTVYWLMLDHQQAVGIIPGPPKRAFAHASMRSTMYLGAAMDDSNAMRRHKWVEDWLVTRGYLVDDRKTCLRWEGFPAQVITRGRNAERKIVLTITPEMT